jgi:hypothetical protein
MALAVFLGGPFLAVGLAPGGKPINLVFGIPVMAFFFGLALWDLGHSDALILDTPARRGLYLRAWYHRRERVEFSLKDVVRLVLVASHVSTGGKSNAPTTFYDLRLELRDGRRLTLSLPRSAEPDDAALRAGRALGLRVEHESVSGFGP